MDPLVVLPAAAIIIITVSALAQKTPISAPLILVLVGIGLSFLPGFPHLEIEPEWILAGVMPPLLFATAVQLPAMDFRRDFAAISGLSIVLVVITSVVLGLVFYALIPAINVAEGIALGAIISPTDSEAIPIVKRLGAPSRVITVLEGEGLLNHASSLLLLRTAIAASTVAISAGKLVRLVAWSAIGGVLVGIGAGLVGLLVRKNIHSPALTSAVSFVVPFAAHIPAEWIGASGMVAVVVAGVVTGIGAARYLTPQDRFFEHANWSTINQMVTGGLFLLMGLRLSQTVAEVVEGETHFPLAIMVALLTMVIGALIRAAYIAPLLWHIQRVAARKATQRGAMATMQNVVDARIALAGSDGVIATADAVPGHHRGPHGGAHRPRQIPVSRMKKMRIGIIRRISDADYLTSRPLGPREGMLLVWSGMRGVITLAAAEILPRNFPHRPLLLLIAYIVGAGSLFVQGGTMPLVINRLGLVQQQHVDDPDSEDYLRRVLEGTARTMLTSPDLRRLDGGRYDDVVVQQLVGEIDHSNDGLVQTEDPAAISRRLTEYRELRLRALKAQRDALLEVRSLGTQDSEQLAEMLNAIDVQQIALEMHAV